ncbi:hypothetical protein Tco_0066936 [Tanacetum coccineum]
MAVNEDSWFEAMQDEIHAQTISNLASQMSQRRLLASLQAPFLKEKKVVKWINVDQLLFWNTLTHDANIVPKPDLALELGKSISLTEVEEEAVAREIPLFVSKKRSSDSSKKFKGIQTLTPAKQEAADIMKALKESKKMSKRQAGTGGSNEGNCPGVPVRNKLMLKGKQM